MTENLERYKMEENREEYNKFYSKEDFAKFPIAEKAFIQALIKKYNVRTGSKILDIACGTGKYTNFFTSLSMDAIGVDHSEVGIEKAQKLYPSSKFKIGNALSLDFPEQSFDLILCSGLPLYNEPDLSKLKDMAKNHFSLLKKDGIFAFVKTTSLTDRPSKGNTRMDFKLETFNSFFTSLKTVEIIGSFAVYPHLFYFLGQLAFSNNLSKVGKVITNLTKIPLRAYIILRKV